jgi:hypothetical protein
MPKRPPEVTLEITRGSCLVQVRGKRSNKGWKVLRVDNAKADPMGVRDYKDDAIQLALDCYFDPNVIDARFLVKPNH